MHYDNLEILTANIHRNAVAHGWWEEERSFPEIIALCHSELSEALEEHRNGKPMLYHVVEMDNGAGETYPAIRTDILFQEDFEGIKPEGIAVELADCIIRILDYCGRSAIDVRYDEQADRDEIRRYTLPELIAECHFLISNAYGGISGPARYFSKCITMIDFWCDGKCPDIEEVIRIKHEYNKTRPYKHGGKKY